MEQIGQRFWKKTPTKKEAKGMKLLLSRLKAGKDNIKTKLKIHFKKSVTVARENIYL